MLDFLHWHKINYYDYAYNWYDDYDDNYDDDDDYNDDDDDDDDDDNNYDNDDDDNHLWIEARVWQELSHDKCVVNFPSLKYYNRYGYMLGAQWWWWCSWQSYCKFPEPKILQLILVL